MNKSSWRSVPLPPGWRRISQDVIKRDLVCQWGSIPEDGAEWGSCNEICREADHIGDASNHSMGNLRGLCKFHHAKRTASQGVAGRARIRSSRPRARPVERHPGWKRDGI
jgi:5-methylcytosine-specific restriction enzyme A